MLERLQKVLANAGVASRRACEELIVQGRVTVDGEVVTELGRRVDPETAELRVDGERVKPRPAVYLMLNKPRGVLSTSGKTGAGHKRAIDFAPRRAGRVFPVGRLDKDSEGLLLLTSDGALTERLTHPRHEVPKVYYVETRGRLGGDAMRQLREGVWLSEGKARVAAVRVVRSQRGGGGAFEITLLEGRNRQIRRMLAKVGVKVKRLVRVAMGPLTLGGLRPGAVRALAPEELEALHAAAGLRGGGGGRKRAGHDRKPRPAGKRAGKTPGPGARKKPRKKSGRKRP